MKKEKLARLEKAGWKAGSVQDFLGLSDTEMAVVEVRVKLAKELRRRRTAKKISQATFAARIGSSQSRVAKMEAGDPSVSLDLLMRSLFRSGSTATEIGELIAGH